MSRKRQRVKLTFSDLLSISLAAGLAIAALALAIDRAPAATIKSHKTGATAQVDGRYVSAFQAYIDDLERHGAIIREMGGWRKGHCSLEHQHPCGGGMALDVCQLRRGVVRRDCKLPPPREMAAIASRHGLYEGSRWCHSDYGHAQVRVTARDCGKSIESTLASISKLPVGATPAMYRTPRNSACLTEKEARARWPKDHLYWHGPDRCWDNSRAMPHPTVKANPLALPPERPPLAKAAKIAVVELPPLPGQCPAPGTIEILRARGMAMLIAAFEAQTYGE